MAKILLFDIETSPCLSYIWSLWQEPKNAKFLVADWYILCWCAKWLDEKKVYHGSLHENPNFKKRIDDDKRIVGDLRSLLDKADIVVAHNGNRFDRKKVNSRMLVHGYPPPSPYRMVDTLTVARGHFGFTSNRLNDLGVTLGVGKKMDTGGFDLWRGCMQGEEKSFKKMVRYCKQDVLLLERVYKRLLPYMPNHPNLSVMSGNFSCPKCGSRHYQKRGIRYTNGGAYREYQCQNRECMGWFRAAKSEKQAETSRNP